MDKEWRSPLFIFYFNSAMLIPSFFISGSRRSKSMRNINRRVLSHFENLKATSPHQLFLIRKNCRPSPPHPPFGHLLPKEKEKGNVVCLERGRKTLIMSEYLLG